MIQVNTPPEHVQSLIRELGMRHFSVDKDGALTGIVSEENEVCSGHFARDRKMTRKEAYFAFGVGRNFLNFLAIHRFDEDWLTEYS